MKRTIAIFLAWGLVVLIGMTSVPPANAGTKGCVTKEEFATVSLGDYRGKVNRAFGTTGAVAWDSKRYIAKKYRVCGYRDLFPHDDKPWAKVHIEFRKGHGVDKIIWVEEQDNIIRR